MTEPFTNGLDVVGYNYYEEKYEQDHRLFPERVMLGSENFPVQIGAHWPRIEQARLSRSPKRPSHRCSAVT